MEMPYRMNGPEELDVKKLLLWPNNPRLKISNFNEVKYTDKELQDPVNQRKILKLLSKHEDHDVGTLIKSMSKVGFMREKAPIVMKVKGGDGYLVLEGNRRLTAIRNILNDSTVKISRANRQSLESIPCWIFEHTSNEVPLKAAISRMVAEAHVKGQKAHSKLQRAHMLYDAYEGFLSGKRKARKFTLDKEVLKTTADFFDFPLKELESEISVVRIYKQFVEAYEYEDIPQKCSERLSWVHKHHKLFNIHFGYNAEELCFDDEGLEKFYEIFLDPEAAVQNPQSFKKILTVMRQGEPNDIDCIREDADYLAEIEQSIRERKSSSRFLTGLQTIEKRLNGLLISDFNKSDDELRAIGRIKSLVDNKLARLNLDDAMVHEPSVPGPGRFKRPKNIQEALSLDYPQMKKQVRKVVRNRANSTCVKTKVASLLLREWDVTSRGKPREAFCNYADQLTDRMIREGQLILYTAKNERVRVK